MVDDLIIWISEWHPHGEPEEGLGHWSTHNRAIKCCIDHAGLTDDDEIAAFFGTLMKAQMVSRPGLGKYYVWPVMLDNPDWEGFD
jgi:hypothetical protein